MKNYYVLYFFHVNVVFATATTKGGLGKARNRKKKGD